MAELAPTPAELIEQLRTELGEPGRPISDDRLAQLVDAPTRQQVIGWRKHGRGMSRKYAERFADLSQQTSRPLTAEAFLAAPRPPGTAELAELVARLEELAESLHRLRVQAATEIVTQLERQTDLLGTIERAAGSLPAAQPAPPSRRAGKRTA